MVTFVNYCLYLILDGVISFLDLFLEPLNVCLERGDDTVSLLQFLLLALDFILKTLDFFLETPNLQAIIILKHSYIYTFTACMLT